MEILQSLQDSAFATWVRESPSLLAYQLFITLHTIGLAVIVGASVGISLRILGVAAGLPLAPMEKYYRFMWIGFWISAFSGLVLFITEPIKFLGIPVLYIKFLALALALVFMQKIRAQVFGDPRALADDVASAKGKTLAAATLAAWGVAILAGRVTSYEPYIQVQTTAAVLIVAVVLGIVGTIVTHRTRVEHAHSARAASSARRSHA